MASIARSALIPRPLVRCSRYRTLYCTMKCARLTWQEKKMAELDDLWPPSVAVARRRADSARTQHGRRDKALSRDEIVQAAVALADSEGAGAVNMRRIAKEIGVGAMSLYWHVADKEQLLDLMLDAENCTSSLVNWLVSIGLVGS